MDYAVKFIVICLPRIVISNADGSIDPVEQLEILKISHVIHMMVIDEIKINCP